ncbi:RbsD/FucU domain-containing protein, partial [Phascolarctobacterium succinatutens]
AMKQLFTEEQWIIDADHEAFKEATKHAKCIIRTGEITPFANVILHSNVFF